MVALISRGSLWRRNEFNAFVDEDEAGLRVVLDICVFLRLIERIFIFILATDL